MYKSVNSYSFYRDDHKYFLQKKETQTKCQTDWKLWSGNPFVGPRDFMLNKDCPSLLPNQGIHSRVCRRLIFENLETDIRERGPWQGSCIFITSPGDDGTRKTFFGGNASKLFAFIKCNYNLQGWEPCLRHASRLIQGLNHIQ